MMNNNNLNLVLNDQKESRYEKLTALIANQKNPYLIEKIEFNSSIAFIVEKYANYSSEKLKELTKKFSLVGRIMAIRQTFLVLKKENQKLQVYFNKNKLDPKIIADFKKYVDIGDVLWVEGNLFLTKVGELTLNAHKFQIISKCLHPLPDKYHGLKDPEIKLRKRYLDAIINDEILITFKLRFQIIYALRQFLVEKGYLEVETPFLNAWAGGANAKPFITKHNTLNQNFYLRIAPELALKKMIIAGFDKIFEIGRCFRNEGMDATHNPEFTSLEMYTAFEDMMMTMDRCESIFHHLAEKFNLKNLNWNGYQINLSQPFKKIRMDQLVFQKTNIDFSKNKITLIEAIKLAKKYHIPVADHQKTVGHIFNLFFEHLCENDLIQPTFVYGYPKDISPLAKIDSKNPQLTQRFELFIGTKEFANGFAELNDPIDQMNRFKDQVNEAKLGNSEANQIDYEFLDALEYGLVPTGGLGIGIDRMIMLFCQQNTIKNVIFFPHLKKEINEKILKNDQ